MSRKTSYSLLLAGLIIAQVSTAQAAVVGYTDEADFELAISGLLTDTLDFDTLSDMDLVPSGSSLQGMTFNYDFGGVSMMVVESAVVGLATTSPPNHLGTNDGDVFQDGDNFSIAFADTVNAFGLSIMTADRMFDGDISLTANGASINLVAADVQQILGDGASVFFLGLFDSAGFDSVEFNTIGGGFFLYTLDDLRTAAVPIPAAAWLFASALLGLLPMLRRKRLAS